MDQEFTQAMSSASRNVNSPYRISLNKQWKVDLLVDSVDPNSVVIRSVRSFHRPPGLTTSQFLRFCFDPAPADISFLINGLRQPVTTIMGLATVPITGMMEPINRIELRWRCGPLDSPQLPEHFAAWLEISDDVTSDH